MAENAVGYHRGWRLNSRPLTFPKDCGDALDVSNAGVTFAPNTSCSTSCTGNPKTICGAGNLLSYYQWVGTPLYKWSYPQGNAAGAYQLLIGGVVVPLITQANVNGKVTFTEKWGTGPA